MKRAMILAAGRGERMRPLTDSLPKPLLEVAGKPLIQHHIERLADAGYKHLVINHAWLGEKIEQQLGDGRQFGVSIEYSAEGEALETAGGIIKALPLLCPQPEDTHFLVVNGDVFCDIDFITLPAMSGDNLAHLVMVDNPEHNPNGDFALKDKLLAEQGDKLTFSGIALYHKDFFTGLSIEKMPLAPIFRKYIAQQRISGQHHQGQWSDVGTPERLARLNQQEG